MIKDKTILFGYGTVLGWTNAFKKSVTLQIIQPPKEIGVKLSSEDISDVIVLEEIVFDYEEDIAGLIKELETVKGSEAILFRGYTFDFTKYNEKSVEAVIGWFKKAIRGWQLALAC